MAVEKGQKYKGNLSGKVYEILSDVFQMDDVDYVVWREPSLRGGNPQVDTVESFKDSSLYTLIREPKFKVGDKVAAYSDNWTIDAVSSKADPYGEFVYIGTNLDGYFQTIYENSIAKAAE
jgi:hypothetical protein